MRPVRSTSIALLLAALAAGALGQTAPATGPADSQPAGKKFGQPVTTDINPGQTVTLKAGDRDISGYLVTPKLEMSETKRPSVILVHDICGMTDWNKHFAEDLARQGYTVLAPDLYSRIPGADKGFDISTPAGSTAAAAAYAATSDQQAVGDIHAALEYLEQDGQPTAKQPIAVVGVDMGGAYAIESAASELRINAAVNFYGRIVYTNTGNERPVSPFEVLRNLQAPLLSFYGDQDPGAPADHIHKLEQGLAKNPNHIYYEVVTLPGVGHSFLKPGREGYNADAAKASMEKVKAFLARYLRAEPAKEDTAI